MNKTDVFAFLWRAIHNLRPMVSRILSIAIPKALSKIAGAKTVMVVRVNLADRPSEKVDNESDSVPHRTETEPLPFNQAE